MCESTQHRWQEVYSMDNNEKVSKRAKIRLKVSRLSSYKWPKRTADKHQYTRLSCYLIMSPSYTVLILLLFIPAFSNYQVLSHQEVFFPRNGRKRWSVKWRSLDKIFNNSQIDQYNVIHVYVTTYGHFRSIHGPSLSYSPFIFYSIEKRNMYINFV